MGGVISAAMERSEESRLSAVRPGLEDVESLDTYTPWLYFGLGREVETDLALWNPGVQKGVKATLGAVKDGLNLDGYDSKISGGAIKWIVVC